MSQHSSHHVPARWVAFEHWDVIEDEATREQSKSGLAMFGDVFTK
jgi:hypothetical protein